MGQDKLPLTIPGIGEEKSPGELLQKGLEWAPHGAIAGAIAKGVPSLLSGGNVLADTLGGAIAGLVGGTGVKAYTEADPFQRGGMAGQALQAAGMQAAKDIISGRDIGEAAQTGIQTGLQSLLAGKGRFPKEDQDALIQQFTQSILPTAKGFERRKEILRRAGKALMSENPTVALEALKLVERVAPDTNTSTAAGHARQRILSGRFRAPEERTALASLGRRMVDAAGEFEKFTPFFDQLRQLNADYASGKLTPEQFSQRVGIITGRFGSQSEAANRLRNMTQQLLAREIPRKALTKTEARALSEPVIGNLVRKALSRGMA